MPSACGGFGLGAVKHITRIDRRMMAHHVTGTEMIHLPLLSLWAISIALTSPDRLKQGALFGEMDRLFPLDLWAAVAGVFALVKLASILWRRVWLQQVSLALVSAWWFTMTALHWRVVGNVPIAAIFAWIGFTALWRSATLALEEAVRG